MWLFKRIYCILKEISNTLLLLEQMQKISCPVGALVRFSFQISERFYLFSSCGFILCNLVLVFSSVFSFRFQLFFACMSSSFVELSYLHLPLTSSNPVAFLSAYEGSHVYRGSLSLLWILDYMCRYQGYQRLIHFFLFTPSCTGCCTVSKRLNFLCLVFLLFKAEHFILFTSSQKCIALSFPISSSSTWPPTSLLVVTTIALDIGEALGILGNFVSSRIV